MIKRFQLLRIDKRGFVWSWHDELPYKVLRLMCWDDANNGFCEPGLDLTKVIWINDVIDWETKKRGSIYSTLRGKTFIWWWYPQYGSDKNPHIERAEWISLA